MIYNETMTISLSPELDRLLNERLSSGHYSSIEDLLTAALHALRAEEDTIAAIAEGHEDYLAGRFTPLDQSDAAFRIIRGLPAVPE